MNFSPSSPVGYAIMVVWIVFHFVRTSAAQTLEGNGIVPDDQVNGPVTNKTFQNLQAHLRMPHVGDFIQRNELNRIRRQENSESTTTTTTPKPKKHRPSNIFNLISVLVSETREDANRAFNEIGTLFNSQFVNGTTSTTTTTTSSPSNSTDASDEDEDVASTTEPFRITRNEFFGVLRSNVQGLVQLFGKEFRVALQARLGYQRHETKGFAIRDSFDYRMFKDSNRNVREFGRDLKNAIWPYFTRPKNSTT